MNSHITVEITLAKAQGRKVILLSAAQLDELRRRSPASVSCDNLDKLAAARGRSLRVGFYTGNAYELRESPRSKANCACGGTELGDTLVCDTCGSRMLDPPPPTWAETWVNEAIFVGTFAGADLYRTTPPPQPRPTPKRLGRKELETATRISAIPRLIEACEAEGSLERRAERVSETINHLFAPEVDASKTADQVTTYSGVRGTDIVISPDFLAALLRAGRGEEVAIGRLLFNPRQRTIVPQRAAEVAP